MKPVFKPLEILGLRLFRVNVCWPAVAGQPARQDNEMVFARSTREAAALVFQNHATPDDQQRPVCQGYNINVGVPEEWGDLSCAVLNIEP